MSSDAKLQSITHKRNVGAHLCGLGEVPRYKMHERVSQGTKIRRARHAPFWCVGRTYKGNYLLSAAWYKSETLMAQATIIG